jgi:septal ring factor EnvC (AmiA/AmiB activator)
MRLMAALFMIAFTSASFATAPPVTSEKVKADFENARQSLVESDEKQRAIMSSIFQINIKMKKLVSERSKTSQEKMMVESSTRKLAERILELEQKLKDQRTLLQVRLNAIYKFGGQGLARLLFSSSNSAQLERNLKILGLVAKHDLGLLKDYSKNVSDLESKQTKFLGRLAALKKIQRQLAGQESKITSESVAKAQILESIRKTKTKALSKIRKLREKSVAVQSDMDDELLDLLLRPSFFERKGQLAAPVQGVVVRKFGIWKDSEFNVSMSHKGLLYDVGAQNTVHAVFPGKVSFSGDVEGLGETLIVDHGDHYYSVYSGDLEPQIKEGFDVGEGQLIANSKNQLYFEIRHFSEPYDPQQWMKGRQQ